MKLFVALVAFLLNLGLGHAQDRTIQFNPTKDKSAKYGYYVPKDLDDALNELDKAFGKDEKAHILAMKSQAGMIEYHMDLGMWLRNNWELWGHGRLYTSLTKLGIGHPDDLSGLIFEEYWRKLHGLPLDTDAFVAKTKAYWEANREAPHEKCPWDQTSREMKMGFYGREIVKGFPGLVSFYRCERGHLWAWHYKKGWFRPEGELLKEFHQDEKKQQQEGT